MNIRWNVLTLVSLFALGVAAHGQSSPNHADELRADGGFVFLDGQYLPAPYRIRIQDNRLLINDRPASEPPAPPVERPTGERASGEGPPADFHGLPARRGPRGFGDRGRREAGPPPFPRPGEANAIREHLAAGAVFIYLPGRPHIFLSQSLAREYFLQVLIEKGDRGPFIEKTVRALGEQIDRDQWRSWLAELHPPASVVAQAEKELTAVRRLEEAGREAFESQVRLRSLAYPLTVVGMVLAVFALGHLLQSPPDSRTRPQSTRRCARHCRAAVISLSLIVLLSGLDLVWTLLASQAGQMTELNPIGNRMLNQPSLLAALKVGSTLMSCGVLLVIRRHPRAQLATWWLCLVLTVLTFRWLVLNSMFVA